MENPLSALKVMLVDDDETITYYFSLHLKQIFKEVVAFNSAGLAIDGFLESAPDIVLTDIRMPDISGIELSKAIRNIKSDIPIIFLSASNDDEYLPQIESLQKAEFILKPANIERLKEKCISVLEAKE